MTTAEVMNGTVEVGDTIAYSTRYGSSQFMHLATVNLTITGGRLRVIVTASSDRVVLVARRGMTRKEMEDALIRQNCPECP